MTELDDALVPAVLDIIDELGADMTFRITSGGAYNPATGDRTGESTVEYTRKASPPSPYSSRYIDGDLIREDDAKIMVAASGLAFTPIKNMEVEISGEKWKTVSVKRLWSGEQVCGWEMQLRR